nr:immunoglobulin heavy chain junction region [Mus musculus]
CASATVVDYYFDYW